MGSYVIPAKAGIQTDVQATEAFAASKGNWIPVPGYYLPG